MTAYIVSYDLRKPGQNYSPLIEAIKSYGYYAKPLESFWIIKTTRTAGEVRDHLRQFIDTNDRLLVIAAGSTWASYNVDQANVNWIKEQIRG